MRILLNLLPQPSGGNGDKRREDHQRPQVELEAAAFAFRRIAHGRIIRRRGQMEQGILGGRTRAGIIWFALANERLRRPREPITEPFNFNGMDSPKRDNAALARGGNGLRSSRHGRHCFTAVAVAGSRVLPETACIAC